MAVSFFDMAVSATPPNGHVEPYPLLLGPNWRPNDQRILMVSGSGSGGQGATALMMPMHDDPPAGFTSAYSLNATKETEGVYWRRLVTGDLDSSVYWVKPAGWRHFVWSTMTVRGADPAVAPMGGRLAVTSVGASGAATVSSVSVPAAGVMVFLLATVNDVDKVTTNWAVPIGVPTGWTHLVATDKSGAAFFQYDTNPAIAMFAKQYGAAGSTGSVTVPIGVGGPAFAALWCFIRAAQSVTISVGAV